MIATKPLRWLAAPIASIVLFGVTAAALDRGRFLPSPGAGEWSEEDRQWIIGAVSDFHRVYKDFYATAGGIAMLEACPATTEVKHRVFMDIGFLRDSGLVLVQDLAQVTLLDVRKAGPDLAEVVVYEEWNYAYRRIADRSIARDVRGLGQGFRYTVRRTGGRWLVAGWVPEDRDAPRDEEGFKW